MSTSAASPSLIRYVGCLPGISVKSPRDRDDRGLATSQTSLLSLGVSVTINQSRPAPGRTQVGPREHERRQLFGVAGRVGQLPGPIPVEGYRTILPDSGSIRDRNTVEADRHPPGHDVVEPDEPSRPGGIGAGCTRSSPPLAPCPGSRPGARRGRMGRWHS